jgi:hypothetical protein
LKLLLDEMYPSFIARELRTRGHDVVSVHESPGSGTSDERVLDHARSEGEAQGGRLKPLLRMIEHWRRFTLRPVYVLTTWK